MAIDAKGAAIIAKKYFEETKTTTYFLFETSKVTKEDDLWLVKCDVKNIFEEQIKKYTMIIDEDGTIMDVQMYD